jgi:hypothetical protein
LASIRYCLIDSGLVGMTNLLRHSAHDPDTSSHSHRQPLIGTNLPVKRDASLECPPRADSKIKLKMRSTPCRTGLAILVPKRVESMNERLTSLRKQAALSTWGRVPHAVDPPQGIYPQCPHLQLKEMLARITFARFSPGVVGLRWSKRFQGNSSQPHIIASSLVEMRYGTAMPLKHNVPIHTID